jgi:hypothetical protein
MPNNKRTVIDGKAECRHCNEWKSVKSFVSNNRRLLGICSICKSCRNYKLKDKRRHHTKYGLNDAQYSSLKQHFGNRCGICGKTEKENKRKLAIDHEHDSGRVRGILCRNCNAGIGLLGDNLQGVTKALQYLLNVGTFNL